ncbi:RAM signaling network component [Recurvomyces mirabilis]|uniref:RAM signaling network component n=1 Tax=Recurvomyces mirabilis TaxID=574656 RepID=A0AAE1C1W0_9PEZI|nr:RAM signaling network component [Recurvomyces mirabilis]KAK5158362.1 RAM signaling network component [Recurvomyces mirabilis]
MPEPLSIVTGVTGLLKVTWTVGVELKAFRDGVKVVNTKLDGLIQDVEGLETVLKSMRETFANITAVYGTGHIGSHWQNIAQALIRGIALVEQLRDEFKKIDKRTAFLDAPRKQFRVNMATDTIAALRVSIQSYRDSLQLSLQTMIVWNQASQLEATGQVLPRLNELEDEIHRIAPEIIAIIQAAQGTAMSEQDKRREEAMSSALECVRSAASIVSSASTVSTLENDDDDATAGVEQDVRSDFGGYYAQAEMMNRWEVASDRHAFDDRATWRRPESIADVLTLHGDSAGESDSDDDLDGEMAMLSFRAAQELLAAGDRDAGERKLQECLSRLALSPRSPRHGAAARNVDGQALELQILTMLYDVYFESSRWQDAQTTLMRKMHLQERLPPQSQLMSLSVDTLKLAELLHKQTKYSEAVLQARRALKGFRKQKDVAHSVLCLDLLVVVCESEGKNDDAGAYMDLRAHILTSSVQDATLQSPEEKIKAGGVENTAAATTEVTEASSVDASVGAEDSGMNDPKNSGLSVQQSSMLTIHSLNLARDPPTLDYPTGLDVPVETQTTAHQAALEDNGIINDRAETDQMQPGSDRAGSLQPRQLWVREPGFMSRRRHGWVPPLASKERPQGPKQYRSQSSEDLSTIRNEDKSYREDSDALHASDDGAGSAKHETGGTLPIKSGDSSKAISSSTGSSCPGKIRKDNQQSVVKDGDRDEQSIGEYSDSHEQFGQLCLKLESVCDLVSKSLPSCRTESAAQKQNAAKAGLSRVAQAWDDVLEKCDIVIAANTRLYDRLSVIKSMIPAVRNQMDFWQLCHVLVASWTDLASEIMDISPQRYEITTIRNFMRPVQKAMKEVSEVISTSPVYLEAMRQAEGTTPNVSGPAANVPDLVPRSAVSKSASVDLTPHYKRKVVVVGDSAVGKTALLMRLINDTYTDASGVTNCFWA